MNALVFPQAVEKFSTILAVEILARAYYLFYLLYLFLF